jgi:tRNA modification GTPase
VFSTQDTIVAIATPPGRGGIGIVRLSGPDAQAIVRTLVAREASFAPRHATMAVIRLKPDPTQTPGPPQTLVGSGLDRIPASAQTDTAAIDQVIVTCFPAPASYTGDDVVELSAHGSPVVLNAIVSAAMSAGARLAEPGEFTLRAFLNGRMDLMQAEAVADLVNAVTPLQARSAFDQLQGTLTRAIGEIDAALFDLVARLEASIDFPEEGYHFVDPSSLAEAIDGIIDRTRSLLADGKRGRLVREGLQIAIVGRPNVGKSSLFNELVGASRAIVTDVPGTTRDLVAETVDLDGLRVTLVDTAGLRDTDDVVEAEGVRRSTGAASVSDLILIVSDGSQPLQDADRDIFRQFIDKKALIVINKQDLGLLWGRDGAIPVSAATGAGVNELRTRIFESLDFEVIADRPALTNARHMALVERAHDSLLRARTAALADGGSLSEEFVLADLQDARAALEEITGKRAPEELLTHIFARFCIGK